MVEFPQHLLVAPGMPAWLLVALALVAIGLAVWAVWRRSGLAAVAAGALAVSALASQAAIGAILAPDQTAADAQYAELRDRFALPYDLDRRVASEVATAAVTGQSWSPRVEVWPSGQASIQLDATGRVLIAQVLDGGAIGLQVASGRAH